MIAPNAIAAQFVLPSASSALAVYNFDNPNYGPPCVDGQSSVAASLTGNPNVTASPWTLTRSSSGGCDNSAGFTSLQGYGSATYTFGLTALYGATLTEVTFDANNNDCQFGSGDFCEPAQYVNWQIDRTINGATTPVATFSGGSPEGVHSFSFTLSDTLAGGESVLFSLYNTSGPVVGTANFGFFNARINGTATESSVAPEPATFVIVAAAVCFLGLRRVRRTRS